MQVLLLGNVVRLMRLSLYTRHADHTSRLSMRVCPFSSTVPYVYHVARVLPPLLTRLQLGGGVAAVVISTVMIGALSF